MGDAVTDRPALLAPTRAGIPAYLQGIARWAPWRAAWNARRRKYDKIPHRAAQPDWGLSTRAPEAWAAFDAAWAVYAGDAAQRFAGIGYCMTRPHGVIGVDLDGCRGEDGEPDDFAREIIARLASYTEVSPSGRGYRIFLRGDAGRDWANFDCGIEVYSGYAPRFLTVTGAWVAGTPTELAEADGAVLRDLEATYAKERSANVVELDVFPEVIDDVLLPPLSMLHLPADAEVFFTSGDAAGGDRSALIFGAAVSLAAGGMPRDQVFSVLANNEHVLRVALEHRREDHDRALAYLWRQAVQAAARAGDAVATPDEFEVVVLAGEEGEAPPAPTFKRDKLGRIEAIVENVVAALQREDFCGMRIRHDQFRDEVLFARYGAPEDEYQRFIDHHYVDLRLVLERKGFKPIGRELVRDAVNWVAQRQQFDAAIAWLGRQAWDGVHRIDTFLADYFGVADTPYSRAVSAYLWTAMAGRVLAPGVKADMVPILVGAQGTVKSSAIAAMVPAAEHACEINLAAPDDDLARRMRGVLLGEIGELRGLHTKDLEGIKAFITRQAERWVPKYQEFAREYPRRIVFIGTTNEDEFLADQTGNRRWLPVTVDRIDIAGIRAAREQLWAEAALRFDLGGVEFRDAEKLAPEIHEAHMIREVWAEAVGGWLDRADPLTGEVPRKREFLRVSEVAQGALGLEPRQFGKREEMRICNALRELGYTKVFRRIDGKPTKVWEPKT